MHFHVISLFPKSFDSYLGESILKRAIEDKKLKVFFYNPRDFASSDFGDNKKSNTKNKWANKRIDRPPYGGGPGMVIQAEPVARSIDFALKKAKGRAKIILLSPRGKGFTNEYAKKIAQKNEHVILVCGRYEGIDARIKKIFKMDEISVGPYILTGGELPAMILIDVISRQVAGILGNYDSLEERRVSTSLVYTRPESFLYKKKMYKVPKILLSGDRAKIEEWKKTKK